ncbi:hypothetical protein EQU24_05090 [Methylotuvimicrobium buryatense]|uniref:Uncharacterized protein n=1 Tax=Methylotuvimicrobium buryatense TaxID=95641 RepID=A0A4P9UNB2_METBY|nr:hypothetical protein EQU24_05090 [Methylotuvimicrobium buryatense]
MAGVGGRADFCSSAIAELHGCNECRKCRSIFLPCIALIHAIHGVMQNLHSCHPWQSVAAVKPTRTYSRRPAKRVTEPSTRLIVPGRYLSRNPKINLLCQTKGSNSVASQYN